MVYIKNYLLILLPFLWVEYSCPSLDSRFANLLALDSGMSGDLKLETTGVVGLCHLHRCYFHEKNLFWLSPCSSEEMRDTESVSLLLYASEILWLVVRQQYCDYSYYNSSQFCFVLLGFDCREVV